MLCTFSKIHQEYSIKTKWLLHHLRNSDSAKAVQISTVTCYCRRFMCIAFTVKIRRGKKTYAQLKSSRKYTITYHTKHYLNTVNIWVKHFLCKNYLYTDNCLACFQFPKQNYTRNLLVKSQVNHETFQNTVTHTDT